MAIIPTGKDTIELSSMLTVAAKTGKEWLANNSLKSAVHKSELMIITKTRTHDMAVDIEGTSV